MNEENKTPETPAQSEQPTQPEQPTKEVAKSIPLTPEMFAQIQENLNNLQALQTDYRQKEHILKLEQQNMLLSFKLDLGVPKDWLIIPTPDQKGLHFIPPPPQDANSLNDQQQQLAEQLKKHADELAAEEEAKANGNGNGSDVIKFPVKKKTVTRLDRKKQAAAKRAQRAASTT